MKRVLLLAVCAAAAVSYAERQKFERYQTIVDRQVFGVPPEGFDPAKPGQRQSPADARAQRAAEQAKEKEEKKLKSAVRFSVINLTPAGETFVGFTDSSDAKKGARNYYLKVGDEKDGWLVKEADAAKATMTIVKRVPDFDGGEDQDISITLSIGGDSSKEAAKPSVKGGAERGLTGSSMSLRERRRQEREKRAAEKAAQEETLRKVKEDAEATRAELEAQRAALDQRAKEDDARRKEDDAKREDQRKQLMRMAEELKKAREQRKGADEGGSSDEASDEK